MAQLALLRLLFLQREVRRSVHVRHRDAAAILTRVCIDTCLVGLFCLASPDAPARLHAHGIKSIGKLLDPVTNTTLFPGEFLESMLAQFGQAKAMPTAWDLARDTASITGRDISLDLYRRLFDPLSMLFVHAGAMSLMRHVDTRDAVRDRPMHPWTGIAALRASDACLGFLAQEVAEKRGVAGDEFGVYGNAHWVRTPLPLIVAVGRTVPRSVHWAQMPGALRELAGVSKYYRSGRGYEDPTEVREQTTRHASKRFLGALGTSVDPLVVDAMVESLVQALAAPRANAEQSNAPGAEENR